MVNISVVNIMLRAGLNPKPLLNTDLIERTKP